MLASRFIITRRWIVLLLLLPSLRAHQARDGASHTSFRDPQVIPTNYVGDAFPASAVPLALAEGDFDEDGMPDLVSGYATSGRSGIITIHRGNVNALWPYGPELRNGEPPAFLPNARVFSLLEAPQFLGAGDFNADGHWDVITARRGGNSLYLLPGDGHGGFGKVQRIELPGSVTALVTGEMNRRSRLPDIVVAINGTAGPQVLVFESPKGAINGTPEVLTIPVVATSLALGPLHGSGHGDLAIAAGNQVVIVRGRDRKLTLDEKQQQQVPSAVMTARTFPFVVAAIATGRFTGTSQADLALLSNQGRVYLLTPSPATATGAEALTAPGPAAPNSVVRSAKVPFGALASATSRVSALASEANQPIDNWQLIEFGALPAQASSLAVRSRVSGSSTDDLMLASTAGSQLSVVRFRSDTSGTTASMAGSVNLEDQPMAVLPMRLTAHSRDSLVALHANSSAPMIIAPNTPMTFTVNTADDHDDGSCTLSDCTLREAINAANANSGADTIAFNIPGSGVHTINVHSALPALTDAVIIDGYTQPSASPNTLANGDNAVLLIEINGASAGQGSSGLQVATANCTIRGLVINNFSFRFDSSSNTDDGGMGIDFSSNSGASNNIIEGNFIGTDPTGTIARPNNNAGIWVFDNSNNNTFGGTVPAARNLISGNQRGNLNISVGGVASGNIIEGNFIGTDITGTLSLSTTAGVFLYNAQNTTVGGTVAGARNILSGNFPGVEFNAAGSPLNNLTGTVVQGNFIGPDVNGNTLGNSDGIDYGNAFGTIIGGPTAGSANVVSGNSGNPGNGIYLYGANTTSNVIQGNFIGTNANGSNQGNSGDGVTITDAHDNTIGGVSAGTGNVIAFNGHNGVTVTGTGSGDGTNNAIEGNSIHDNGSLGIDLGNDGVTANNPCNSNQAGPNQLQNYPVLTSVPSGNLIVTATATDPNGNTSEFAKCATLSSSSRNLKISGTLNSTPDTTFRIEFFENAACNPSGFGEGMTFLGSAQVTTGSSCSANINTTVSVNPPVLSITKTHSGNFAQGQENATYQVLVSNAAEAGSTTGTVTVTEQVPSGLSLVSMNGGATWNCSANTCTSSVVLAGGQSYPAITVTVNVASNATSPQVNAVSVSGGGSAKASTTDSTIISSTSQTPVITWSNPADILFGSALGPGQLNATANVPGTFAYTPPAGTVPPIGDNQALNVKFTPSDSAHYTTATKTVFINVKPASSPGAPANLAVTYTLARDKATQNVTVKITVANSGGTTATTVQLNAAHVGATNATPLPQAFGTIAAGGQASATVTLPSSVGPPGKAGILTVGGTYVASGSTGKFNLQSKIILP